MVFAENKSKSMGLLFCRRKTSLQQCSTVVGRLRSMVENFGRRRKKFAGNAQIDDLDYADIKMVVCATHAVFFFVRLPT